MTWNDVLIEAVELVFKAVTALVIPYLAYLVGKKIKNDHAKELMHKAEEFVVQSVQMVQQTFVDSLKKEGKFDAQAQREAFKLCYDAWLTMANEEMKQVVTEEVGNLDSWLTALIEANVYAQKEIEAI